MRCQSFDLENSIALTFKCYTIKKRDPKYGSHTHFLIVGSWQVILYSLCMVLVKNFSVSLTNNNKLLTINYFTDTNLKINNCKLNDV